MKILILLGPPGSGKGTQAGSLAKTLAIPHISTGDIFRENMKNGTALGLKAKSYIESGKLVPDEIVLEMLFDRVQQDDCKDGFLLDGFPRTTLQAEALDNFINTTEASDVKVVNLTVKDEVITQRAEGRLTCRQCGQVYNKYFSPSKIENRCDTCQGDLYQRPDDNLEVVKERLRVYHAQSKPLIDFYTTKGILTNIDGEATKDVVAKQLLETVL